MINFILSAQEQKECNLRMHGYIMANALFDERWEWLSAILEPVPKKLKFTSREQATNYAYQKLQSGKLKQIFWYEIPVTHPLRREILEIKFQDFLNERFKYTNE